MGKKKTPVKRPVKKNPKEEPVDFELIAYAKVMGFTKNIDKFITVSGNVFLAYFGYLSLSQLAGKTTLVTLVAKILDLDGLKDVLMLMLVVCFFALWMLERKLRFRTIASQSKTIKDLQVSLNPDRTTSTLTVVGQTNPKDI